MVDGGKRPMGLLEVGPRVISEDAYRVGFSPLNCEYREGGGGAATFVVVVSFRFVIARHFPRSVVNEIPSSAKS